MSLLWQLTPLRLCLQIFSLALAVVIGEVAVLAEAFRVVELVSVLTRPSLLCAAAPVVAVHAHVLRIVAPLFMRAAHDSLHALPVFELVFCEPVVRGRPIDVHFCS